MQPSLKTTAPFWGVVLESQRQRRPVRRALYSGPAVSTNSAMNSSSAMPVFLSTYPCMSHEAHQQVSFSCQSLTELARNRRQFKEIAQCRATAGLLPAHAPGAWLAARRCGKAASAARP